MVDRLDQHNVDRRVIGSTIQVEDARQIQLCGLLREGDKRLPRLLSPAAQLVEAWEDAALRQARPWRLATHTSRVAFLGAEQVHEDRAHAAIHPGGGLVQLRVGERLARVEQNLVSPEIVAEEIGKPSAHSVVFLSWFVMGRQRAQKESAPV